MRGAFAATSEGGIGYGLWTQNRKNSGRVWLSVGSLTQRTRGVVPARGCCWGGGDEEEEQPSSSVSSATIRRARITGRYDNSAHATRLRTSLAARRRRAPPPRHEGAAAARMWRTHEIAPRDLCAGRSAQGPDAARRNPPGRLSLRAAGARGDSRRHLADVTAPGGRAAARTRRVRAGALLRPRHRVRARRSLGARLCHRPHGAAGG